MHGSNSKLRSHAFETGNLTCAIHLNYYEVSGNQVGLYEWCLIFSIQAGMSLKGG